MKIDIKINSAVISNVVMLMICGDTMFLYDASAFFLLIYGMKKFYGIIHTSCALFQVENSLTIYLVFREFFQISSKFWSLLTFLNLL